MWRARDPDLGVDRAVKLLDDSPGDDGVERRERLRREARAMASLGHPHVLQVLDIGEHDGRPFVVMPLAARGSLADRVQDEGPLDLAETVRVLRQVLSATGAAHAAGIVHRDIKPQNILVDADGDALLADFGIARLVAEDGDRSTRTGMALGSLAYMAPEQRLDASRVGPAADLYAVGATAYHLLTGLSPMDLFVAGPDDPRWAGVPPAVRAELVRATRYAPEERHADAEALAVALAAAASRPIRAEATVPPAAAVMAPVAATRAVAAPAEPPPAPPARRRGLLAPLLVILGFSLALGGAVLWLRGQRAVPPTEAAAAVSAAPAPAPGPEAAEPSPAPGSGAAAPAPAAALAAPPPPEAGAAEVAAPSPAPERAPAARSPAPAPSPAASPPAEEPAPPESTPAALAAVAGAWVGSFGGSDADLRLRAAGAEAAGRWPVAGDLVVKRNTKAAKNPVEGVWIPAERRLSLRTPGGGDIMLLELRLGGDGNLSGTVGSAGGGGQRQAAFYR